MKRVLRIPAMWHGSALNRPLQARLALALLLLFAVTDAGNAQGFNGIDLYKACKNIGNSAAVNEALCLGYIRGFTEGTYLGIYQGRLYERSKMKDCLPTPQTGDPIDVTQAELIIKKFLAEHPDRLNEPAPTLVFEALLKGFHCYFRD